MQKKAGTDESEYNVDIIFFENYIELSGKLLRLSLLIYCFAYLGCSNRTANKAGADKPLAETSSTTKQLVNTFSKESEATDKAELVSIYSRSIAEYIKAVNKTYEIKFDTLFFGKHVYGQPDDFPDIELPETIENTPIRLLTPEAGNQKQKERRSLFFINLVGWVNEESAEFIFVTFTNGGEHQFDGFIDFKYNPELKAFELENTRFENYLYKKE